MNSKSFFVLVLLGIFVWCQSVIGQETDYEIAKSLYEKGDYEGAYDHYSKALKQKKDYRSYMGRAQVLISQEKFKEAINDYTAAIKLEPEDSRIYYNRGNCFLEMKEEQAAFADFNKAIDLDPANYHAYNSRGYMYFKKDSLGKAEEDYLRAISMNLNFRRAYFNLADLYVVKNQQEIALELIAEYIQHNSQDYKAYTYIGLLYLRMGNYELASKFLGTSLSIEMKQPFAVEQLGEILVFYLKDYTAAIQFLEEAKKVNTSPKIQYLLGLSYFSQSEFESALSEFRKVEKLENDSTVFQIELLVVSCLDELGRDDEVIHLLDSLEGEKVLPAEVSMQKSLYYLKKQDFKSSIKYLDKSIELHPTTKGFIQKAYLLGQTGKAKQAIELYEKLDTASTYFNEIQQGKGSLLESIGEMDQACACYYRSVVNGDRDKSMYLLKKCGSNLDSAQQKVLKILDLMQVYQEKRMAYTDLNDYDYLIQNEPNVYDFRLWRGVHLKSEKKYQEAIRDFSKCIELSPKKFEGYFFAGNTQLEAEDTNSFITTITLGIHKTKSIELYYNRALFYMSIKDFEYAFADLKEILNINPSYSNAYFQLGKLFIENDEKEKACKYFKQALLLGHSKARLEYKISCAD
ncbi:MAG: tetratricopeptide repeat protein [Crocinitomicaceae bacterium]|nr:tetratricopeptide repeat protein [Crocinitomicaceae bacterium]